MSGPGQAGPPAVPPKTSPGQTVVLSRTPPCDGGGGSALRRRLLRWLGGGATPSSEPAAGEWRYAEAQELARGGMGTVYLVRDCAFDRRSAMKVALPAIARDPANAERFLTEARITAQLEHPNVVPVHDLGRTPEDLLYYTMKLIDGQPLNSILERLGRGDEPYARRYDRHVRLTIFRKVCDAVAYAHAHRIIHRDIKPDNVMVGAYGEVLLMDWGIAKRLDAAEPDEGTAPAVPGGARTACGIIKGTPAYMAPEQARGDIEAVDFQTDVFLLGATLYSIVTLLPPYAGRSTDEVINRAAQRDLVPPAEAAPAEQVPEELCRIIERAMAADKAARYPSVAALCEDLDNLMAGRTQAERRRFQDGECLIRQGEAGGEGYVLLSGRVEVFREEGGARISLGTLGPGDVVGEMAVLTGEARSASVVAETVTEVQVITAEVMHAEMRKLGPWMGRIVNTLAQRLRSANSRLHPLLCGPCEAHVACQLRLLGRGRATADGESQAVSLPLAATVAAVSHNLALPPERTLQALETLAAAGRLDVDRSRDECRFRDAALAAVPGAGD